MGAFFDLFKSKKKTQIQEEIKNKKILVVDDMESDRLLIQRTLERLGCQQVFLAEDGQEGYEITLDIKPDLILSDCRMPVVDGIEMCRRIKENDSVKDIPVVFLTSYDSPKRVIDCFDVDAVSFLCKPIDIKIFKEQIYSILKNNFS